MGIGDLFKWKRSTKKALAKETARRTVPVGARP